MIDTSSIMVLQKLAHDARLLAYAPYSKYTVGAAVLMADGRTFSGCNIENASYSLTMCAERAAVYQGIIAGAQQLVAAAIAGPPGTKTSPCGACRQVFAEFSAPTMLISYQGPQGWVNSTLAELLPHDFRLP